MKLYVLKHEILIRVNKVSLLMPVPVPEFICHQHCHIKDLSFYKDLYSSVRRFVAIYLRKSLYLETPYFNMNSSAACVDIKFRFTESKLPPIPSLEWHFYKLKSILFIKICTFAQTIFPFKFARPPVKLIQLNYDWVD